MKNCIIVHGCANDEVEAMNPNSQMHSKHWIPWIKEQLESKAIKTEAPLMPNSWAPVYEDYKREFEKYKVSDESILVGHSCGCAFLVHWLGDTKRKISKLILVAPWKIPYGNSREREIFYGFEIDTKIKDLVGEIVMFTADDEEDDGKKSLKIYQDIIGGKVIELKGHGHYCMDDMGTREFPELLDEILK